MRRLTMVAVSLVAVTGLSALGQEAAKAPAPPTFSSPDGRTPISIPGPMILQIGPPPSVYSPAADFKARIGNAAMVAVLSDDGTQAPSNVVQITDIQADPTNPVLMQAFSLPGFSPTAMPPLPPPGCFVQVPTGYMPPPPAYLPVATRLSIPNPMFPYGGFPTCDAPPACSANCAACDGCGCACDGSHPSPSDCCTAISESNRLEHILEAVHHLEAAGLQADADQLRRRCDDDVKVLIHDLKAAESELAQLRRESFNNCTSMNSNAADYSDNQGVFVESESVKLIWRPVRTASATEPAEAIVIDYSTEGAPESICSQEKAAACCEAKTECCSDSTLKLNLLGIEIPKSCQPFSSGSEIHFEKSPTAQPYEIDPATFKAGTDWSGPFDFGGDPVGR